MMFADGACGATQKSPATSISPKGGGGTASISLSRTRRRRARHKRHRIYGTRHLAGMTHKLSTAAAGLNKVPRPASGLASHFVTRTYASYGLKFHGHQHVLMKIISFWPGFQKALGFLIAEIKLDLLTLQSHKKVEQVLGIKSDPH